MAALNIVSSHDAALHATDPAHVIKSVCRICSGDIDNVSEITKRDGMCWVCRHLTASVKRENEVDNKLPEEM